MQKIGYYGHGMTLTEFNISPYLQKGKNTLAAENREIQLIFIFNLN
jgi:hypothetical protein